MRLARQLCFASIQTPFISPPLGLRRTPLTIFRLPRCAIPNVPGSSAADGGSSEREREHGDERAHRHEP